MENKAEKQEAIQPEKGIYNENESLFALLEFVNYLQSKEIGDPVRIYFETQFKIEWDGVSLQNTLNIINAFVRHYSKYLLTREKREVFIQKIGAIIQSNYFLE